jgi:hypothetical protein
MVEPVWFKPVLDLIDQQDLAPAEGFLLDGQADQATGTQAMPRQRDVLVVKEQGAGRRTARRVETRPQHGERRAPDRLRGNRHLGRCGSEEFGRRAEDGSPRSSVG